MSIEHNLSDLNKSLSCLLKEIRLLYGCSHEDFASVLGCSPGKIALFETNDEKIEATELYLLARHLAIPFDNFFTNGSEHCDAEQSSLETEAYAFLQSFSAIEDQALRRKILEMCKLYEDFRNDPFLASQNTL